LNITAIPWPPQTVLLNNPHTTEVEEAFADMASRRVQSAPPTRAWTRSYAPFPSRGFLTRTPYLILDARYERVRDGGVIVSHAVFIAVAVDGEGRPRPSPWCSPIARAGRVVATFFWASEIRAFRRRVRCLGRSRGPQGRDPGYPVQKRCAALLRALPQERA
jgi:hypothetical protein